MARLNSKTAGNKKNPLGLFLVTVFLFFSPVLAVADADTEKKYYLDENSSYYVTQETWDVAPSGGDTIYISSSRVKALRFKYISGTEDEPVVVINHGGQVNIDCPTAWGALTFENCSYIKVTGTGHPGFKYGFLLAAQTCGLAFSELSTDCEAEFIKIDHEGFYGIMAKKNYDGDPPSPVPVFSNLIIHDCFIQNVTEGMYLGETTTPGQEFKHVKIYNNIVRHTGRESIQIANMPEDVEIYNNTLLDAGNDSIDWQSNILQIGDNSVANVYNNILIGAPKAGIITMGMGSNIYSNNYIASCEGMFIDNRTVSNESYPVTVSGNYFVDNSGDEIILNRNEVNAIVVNNNTYNDNIFFFLNESETEGNLIFANNNKKELSTLSFTNPSEGDFSLAEGTLEIYENMGAPGGAEYFEVADEETDTIQSGQIILSADMIVDEVLVPGGSLYPPTYLVDEQDCTPENGLHPVSQSWKPYYNMTYGPYHAYIDLQDVYTITNISLHDMSSSDPLEVYIGEPGNWQLLFTESCDSYNTWKEHGTKISTRYIRLTMQESAYAAVNEIILYGYKKEQATTEKSASISSQAQTTDFAENKALEESPFLVQNPIGDKLQIDFNGLTEDGKFEVFDLSGRLLKAGNYTESQSSSLFVIDVANECPRQGIYILRYTNSSGRSNSIKFFKN